MDGVDWPDGGLGALDANWRIFARSASDSKGTDDPVHGRHRRARRDGPRAAYNLKVIIDTEEERGSPHLAAAIERDKALLAADFLLIFDGPPQDPTSRQSSSAPRGITTATLTTYGPVKPQHSGHYGNFVPNPNFALARLLASFKDEKGRIRIKGYYDGVKIDKTTRAVLEATPDDESTILSGMGIAAPDAVAASLQEAIQYPSLNVRGVRSAGWARKRARSFHPKPSRRSISAQ